MEKCLRVRAASMKNKDGGKWRNVKETWRKTRSNAISSSVFRGGHAAMAPPRKVRKHFLTRYTVRNGISNLYILLKSALKVQEMPFQRPKFQNGISNIYILLKSALKMQEMPFQRPKFQKISGGACPRTTL